MPPTCGLQTTSFFANGIILEHMVGGSQLYMRDQKNAAVRLGILCAAFYHSLSHTHIEAHFVQFLSSRESVFRPRLSFILFNLRLVSCLVTWRFCHLCVEKVKTC